MKQRQSVFTLAFATTILLAACGDDSTGGTGGDTGGTSSTGGTTSDGGSASTGGTSSAGGTATTGGSGGAATGGAGGAQANVQVSNTNNAMVCPLASQHGIYPVLPDEAGHYATARLTPVSYPFTITQVAYDLVQPNGVAQCADQSLAHQVQLIVSSEDKPSASPSADGSLKETIAVPAGAASTHTVELSLANPITLTSGQSLFVSVQLVGSAGKSLCIGACGEAAAKSDVDYWSNAVAEPFNWADMVGDFGFTYNYMTRAYGHNQ
jgi:hypothetical protein